MPEEDAWELAGLRKFWADQIGTCNALGSWWVLWWIFCYFLFWGKTVRFLNCLCMQDPTNQAGDSFFCYRDEREGLSPISLPWNTRVLGTTAKVNCGRLEGLAPAERGEGWVKELPWGGGMGFGWVTCRWGGNGVTQSLMGWEEGSSRPQGHQISFNLVCNRLKCSWGAVLRRDP